MLGPSFTFLQPGSPLAPRPRSVFLAAKLSGRDKKRRFGAPCQVAAPRSGLHSPLSQALLGLRLERAWLNLSTRTPSITHPSSTATQLQDYTCALLETLLANPPVHSLPTSLLTLLCKLPKTLPSARLPTFQQTPLYTPNTSLKPNL